jgi:hypothetical protein
MPQLSNLGFAIINQRDPSMTYESRFKCSRTGAKAIYTEATGGQFDADLSKIFSELYCRERN